MTLRSKAMSVLLLPGFALAIAASGGFSTAAASVDRSAATASTTQVVTLHDIQFHPATVHIKVGQSVVWKWEDADIETQHNVTSIGRTKFKSSPTMLRGTYTVRFNTAGTYRFECTIHPLSMQGKVVVG
ncbi:MAG: cupredoxin domain-containing protein [Solirubrobacteraceae bacterium]|jgi:plastocyanin